jgi:site-specific DNA-methyltransferase (adenine-specific)
VHCCITSPPYFGLRDYGHDGQIGLEASPDAFVAALVEVFREVRRVLRDDGTLWLNLGDSYAAHSARTNMPAETLAGGIASEGEEKTYRGDRGGPKDRVRNRPGNKMALRSARSIGLKHKDLIGIPWRAAFALQADGWYLRQDIIWHKPNPMPEGQLDRCTKAHEYLFLLSKSQRYYFKGEAIAEPLGAASIERAKVADGDLIGTRNKRSVWTVTTQPFAGAHFATFPPALIEP